MDHSILIQARLSSTRLPGKVLFKLGNSQFNSLTLMIKRLRILENNIDIVLLTSEEKCDDAILFAAHNMGIKCLRGSQNNVLKRYYDCAKLLNTKTIIRLTSDCPFIDPYEIKRVLDIHLKNKNDYTTNTFDGSSIIDGFDVEVFEFIALKRAYEEAFLPSEKEHVTFYFKKENKFKIERTDPKLKFPYTRLTLDTPEDFKAISNLIDKVDNIENMKMLDIIKNFYKFNLNKINSSIEKNTGWESSLIEDEEFKNNL